MVVSRVELDMYRCSATSVDVFFVFVVFYGKLVTRNLCVQVHTVSVCFISVEVVDN